MHELSLCQAIVDSAGAHADGRHIERVTVRIGHLRQVVPDSLLFSWELLTAGTDLAGSVLEIEHVPAVVVCAACQSRSTLDVPILMCADCGALDVELVSGEELVIVSLDVTEQVR